MACWFLLGVLVGIAATEIAVVSAMKVEQHKLTDEEFVKKLIEKKGWTEARWELETSYKGKYMRIWRRLYRAHIEEKGNGSSEN